MPKRTDIKKILIIGSGPITIGQACEFDYSGSQACKVLRQDGYKIILVNSNPATIMTDPEMADRTYVEPITVEVIAKIIEKERPDALLPTLGGQTALNTAVGLDRRGILKKYKVETIGANIKAIMKGEDRRLFKESMLKIGLDLPKSDKAYNLKDACAVVGKIGFPVIIRPSFTLGGTGGSMAYNMEEFKERAKRGLESSMISEVLVEESVIGWKEFELEVMRDLKDNVVIICSIENFDPMGIHTGDSITVAPIQTLTDREYQKMRDAAIACIREIGVETGGSNIQFALNPKNGRMVVIEMNPRVSRSSALASKATGFPIAKIAAKLAVGYTLDEIPNDITKKTPASFEPTLDYVVTKIPRFTFEKFPTTPDILTTQMKSVGEVMAIGRNFKESLLKAIRSLELDRYGLTSIFKDTDRPLELGMLKNASADRLWLIGALMEKGHTPEEVHAVTHIDPWFLRHIQEIVQEEMHLKKTKNLSSEEVERLKKIGFSDLHMSRLTGISESKIRAMQKKGPAFLTVDTCGAEFEAFTPYLYSSYDGEDEFPASQKKKVLILGSGPNRIGQGLEFDYCCVHAAMSLREMGIETLMLNCNPETVSTDYDTSDRLYFEPLVLENVLHVIEKEKPFGVMVQFGGQTPLKLCKALEREGVTILGTSPTS